MIIKPFSFQYKIEENENCFSYLPKLVDELDAAANEFLDQFEFIPSDTIADNIHARAWAVFKENDKDWDKIPEWVADILDCGVPFCSPPRNGSLWYSIGYSIASQDAHLRCFWENIKNNTEFSLPFPVVVPKSVIPAEKEPEKKKKKLKKSA